MHFRKSTSAVAVVALFGVLPLAANGQSAGTPYTGTAPSVPAVIPTVNFDKGGEGIAYRDLSAGNLGGQYRTGDSVDIYRSTDSIIGSYEVANFQTGEWMSYTVNVPASGTYVLSIRASNGRTTGAFHLEVDGVNVTGTISVPKTGSWRTYQWFGKKAVALSAGKHVVKIVSEKQWFNVTALSIQASSQNGSSGTPYSGTPIAAPATFPAVAFDKGGEGIAYHDLSAGNLGGLYRTSESVDIYPSTDSTGGSYKVQNFQTGEWMTYTINVPTSGNYDLGIRSANNLANGASGAFRIEVDGVNVTGSVSVPITGSWDTYQWFGKKGVPLTAGKHVLKLVSEQQWFDVSALTVLSSTTTGGSTGGGTGDAPATPPLWSAGMEAGNMLEWYADGGGMEHNGVNSFVEGNGITPTVGPDGEYSQASRERARSGSWSAKLAITGSQGGVRVWRWKEPAENRELYYSAWFFIPQRYTVGSGGWNNMFQFKSSPTPGGSSDPFFILLWNNQGSTGAMHAALHWWNPPVAGPLPGQSGKRTWMFPAEMPIGRWFNIEIRYVCAGDFTGAVQVWQDGVEMIKLDGIRTRYPDGACASAVTNYATNISPLPYYYYVDDAVISRTRVWR